MDSIDRTQLMINEYLVYIVFALIVVLGSLGKDYVVNWVRKRRDNWEFNRNRYKYVAERDKRINQLLTTLMAKTGGDRATVYMLHNGGEWFTGEPIKKLSCLFEVNREGISREKTRLQNVLIHEIPDAMEAFSREGSLSCIRVEDMTESYWKSLLVNQGTRVMLATPMEMGGRMIGVVTLHFVRKGICEDCDDPAKCRFRSSLRNAAMLVESELTHPYAKNGSQ